MARYSCQGKDIFSFLATSAVSHLVYVDSVFSDIVRAVLRIF